MADDRDKPIAFSYQILLSSYEKKIKTGNRVHTLLINWQAPKSQGFWEQLTGTESEGSQIKLKVQRSASISQTGPEWPYRGDWQRKKTKKWTQNCMHNSVNSSFDSLQTLMQARIVCNHFLSLCMRLLKSVINLALLIKTQDYQTSVSSSRAAINYSQQVFTVANISMFITANPWRFLLSKFSLYRVYICSSYK